MTRPPPRRHQTITHNSNNYPYVTKRADYDEQDAMQRDRYYSPDVVSVTGGVAVVHVVVFGESDGGMPG